VQETIDFARAELTRYMRRITGGSGLIRLELMPQADTATRFLLKSGKETALSPAAARAAFYWGFTAFSFFWDAAFLPRERTARFSPP